MNKYLRTDERTGLAFRTRLREELVRMRDHDPYQWVTPLESLCLDLIGRVEHLEDNTYMAVMTRYRKHQMEVK